jgi:ssDNA-binding Zn-finger/Zn-ribbon topoisomerase 1
METPTEDSLEKIDLSVHEEPGALSGASTEIIFQFDEVLGRHLDRLLGTRQGIETLQMNIFSVSCLILLATRETEIETFPYLPPERYTRQSMQDNVMEMNIESGGDLESYLKSMLDKGYISLSDDGRFFAGPPTMKMAQLFDRLFPKMPGLNLVAYLGQMIDEVFSKRKSLEVALNQFDQMLKLHGLPLKKDADSSQNETGKLYPHLKAAVTSQTAIKKIATPNVKPSDIFSQLQTKAWKAPQSKPEIFVDSFDMGSRDIKADEATGLAGNDGAAIPSTGGDCTDEPEQRVDFLTGQETATGIGHITRDHTDMEKGRVTDSSRMGETESISKGNPDVASKYSSEPPEDDDIEKRITEFEEQLGMACPLCRTAGILPRVTAKGKAYYKCSNDDCNFISWGKPYYITCPKCENPFLIESPDSQGNLMLKCPRATCPHWQKFPWEEQDEPEMKSEEPEQPAVAGIKPRKLVKRRRRVVVRRKS